MAKKELYREPKIFAKSFTFEAVNRLVKIMRESNDALALKAAVELLDRGWGRPTVSVSIPDELSSATQSIAQQLAAAHPELAEAVFGKEPEESPASEAIIEIKNDRQ